MTVGLNVGTRRLEKYSTHTPKVLKPDSGNQIWVLVSFTKAVRVQEKIAHTPTATPARGQHQLYTKTDLEEKRKVVGTQQNRTQIGGNSKQQLQEYLKDEAIV